MGIGRTNAAVGGASLNFDVKAYATEEALLAAAPKENTIGIITENKITSWIFSATEPSPTAAGMVWITTGTSSTIEFNALKKNGIQVYPISAKQYVSGAWVNVPAEIYQGGMWDDSLTKPAYYWFEKGVVNSELGKTIESGAASWFTFDDSAGYFECKVYSNGSSVWMRSTEMIDITDYRTLTLVCEEQPAGVITVGLTDSTSVASYAASGEKSVTGAGEITVDISALAGSFYLFFRGETVSGESATTFKINDISLK